MLDKLKICYLLDGNPSKREIAEKVNEIIEQLNKREKHEKEWKENFIKEAAERGLLI